MANGIELAPLVCEIKANLDNYNKGIDEAERKGTALEEEFKKLNKEAKLNESSFKLAGAGAELLGNKTNILATKQSELTEKLKLQSRAVDLNKSALEKASEKLESYSKRNKELEKNIKDSTKEQEIAKRTFGANSKQVKELENKINSLNKEFNENDESVRKVTEEMNHYKIKLNESQAELLQTQTAIKRNNEEIKKIKIDGINEKLNKTSNVLKEVGSGLTTYVTLPLLAAGTAAVKVGMDFEAKMSRVKAISGATEEQFKTLTDQALELGQKTAFSASECAEGMENLASAGFSVNETTEAMPGLLDLAASAGEDLATSSDIAASTLRGFGLEASQAGHVADVLAKNAGATNAAVKDTGEAMKYIAPVAHTMGLSLEQVTAAIGEMANAGIKGSQAGTTLRAALVRLTKPSDPAIAAMKSIGFTAFDSSGKMKDLSTIVEELRVKTKGLTEEQKENKIATIFGTEALSGMMVLMDNGKEGLDDLTNSYKNCDGAAKEMAETMQDNTKATIEQAGGALETAAIKMLNIVAPAIKDVADGIGDMADKFSALSPETQELILKLGMLGIAGGPVISMLGKGAGLLTKITPLIIKTGVTAGEAGIKIAGAGAAAGTAGVSLGALATVALPLVGALGAIAGGIYLFTKNTELMNSSCLKSSEELGLVGNALEFLHGDIALSAEEMNRLNIKHKEWSDKISPETQKALTETSDKISKLNYELESSNGLDGVISKKQINSLKKRTDNLFNETIKKIKSRAPETQKAMAESFKADDGTLDKNEKELMDFFNQSQNKQIKEVQEYQKQINSIYDKAAKEHRDLKQDEIKTIQDLTIKMGQVNLNNTVKNNQELIAAQADFNARMRNLDMNGLSALLSEKAKARDKELTSIRQNYDKQIEELKLYRPKMNAEQQRACDEQIKKLEKLKTDSVNNEKKKYQGFLDEAMKKYPELIDYINTSNGEIMSDEEQNNYKRLTRYSQHMDGMMGITQTGYYQIRDSVDGSMHDCYVEVDEATGRINGVWDNTTQSIYGNPVKAREAIDQDLKNGQKFQPIANSYNQKKDEIWNNAIKVQCQQDWNLFDWVKTAWDNSIGYVLEHPIESAYNALGGGLGFLPSQHYNGLDNVPYDGYIARLHKGERVLTADENAKYNSTDNSIQVTQNIYTDNASPYEIAKATKQGLRELQFVGR